MVPGSVLRAIDVALNELDGYISAVGEGDPSHLMQARSALLIRRWLDDVQREEDA